ncbi:MAG: hypothetical protein ACHREM_27690, partial [Polyangiales bacterium]
MHRLAARSSLLLAIASTLTLHGCSSSGTSSNPSDASTNDAGHSETGVTDTGSTDTGTADTGHVDTGEAGPVTGNTSSAASYFPSNIYFNVPVDSAPLDGSSATIISTLVTNGGWGLGHLQVDTSIDVYYANSSSKRLPFVDGGLASPDSDTPTTVPIDSATTAGFESSTGKTCDGGDCHYLVMDVTNGQLVEVYQASTDGTNFTSGGSIAIWSFTKAYAAGLRGDVCTSADASGGMMAPLLFTADEVKAGHIDHAIRFILPN